MMSEHIVYCNSDFQLELNVTEHQSYLVCALTLLVRLAISKDALEVFGDLVTSGEIGPINQKSNVWLTSNDYQK